MGCVDILVHTFSLVNFSLCILSQLITPPLPKHVIEENPQMGFDKMGGPWKYLTFWNLWVQAVYAAICLVNDVSGRRKGKDKGLFKRMEDWLYSTLAFPIGMFVGISFWSLFFIDRSLVYPEILDRFIHPVVNHMMHTV